MIKLEELKNMAAALTDIRRVEEKKMDKVDKDAVKGDFDDREDKDIDNDGDVDASDRYLHNRRKAVTKAVAKESTELDEAKNAADHRQGLIDKIKKSGVVKSGSMSKKEENEIDELSLSLKDLQKTGLNKAASKNKKDIEKDLKSMKNRLNNVDEKAESEAQAIAARIALKHKREGTKPEPGSASAEMMKMSEKDLEDFTKMKKGAPYKVNEDAWEEIPMMKRQLQFIKYAADEIMGYMDMTMDPEEWFQNKLAHVHDQMQSLHAYIEGDKRMMAMEATDLDEAKNYDIKDGKIHISKSNFAKVHKDYKNTTPGKERMMALDPKTGATTSFPVVFTESKSRGLKGSTGYELYHKDFSSAMQHAYDFAKKKYGIEVDPKEIDDKVASGPRKPSKGKTNSYRLMGKDGKNAIQVQVYGMDNGKYELNMYKEDVDISEGKYDKRMMAMEATDAEIRAKQIAGATEPEGIADKESEGSKNFMQMHTTEIPGEANIDEVIKANAEEIKASLQRKVSHRWNDQKTGDK